MLLALRAHRSRLGIAGPDKWDKISWQGRSIIQEMVVPVIRGLPGYVLSDVLWLLSDFLLGHPPANAPRHCAMRPAPGERCLYAPGRHPLPRSRRVRNAGSSQSANDPEPRLTADPRRLGALSNW